MMTYTLIYTHKETGEKKYVRVASLAALRKLAKKRQADGHSDVKALGTKSGSGAQYLYPF